MRSVREYTSVPSCTSDWSAMLSLCAGTCTCTSHVRMHLFSISRQPGVEVQEGYTIRRHRRSGYKHFWPTATPSSLSQPCRVPLQHTVHLATWCRAPNVSGKHAETHEAGPAAGTQALTVMATGRHAAGSDFGASAPTAAALKSHPTVPVALPAPLCSCPPTPLSAMPVVTFTLTPQPGGEPGETQPGRGPLLTRDKLTGHVVG